MAGAYYTKKPRRRDPDLSTRLYLRADAAEEPKPNVKQSPASIAQWVPSTLGGGQDGVSEIFPLKMLLSPGSNEAQTIRGTLAETGALHYPWFKAWVSPPLKARLFSGGPGYKIVCDFNEGSSLHNMYPKVYIYIWKGDDSGLRGLLSEIGFTQTECDTTDASLQTWESNFTYEVQAQDGDRLVIEMMGRDDNVKTVSYLHAINIDGAIGGNRESYFEVYLVLTFIDNKKPYMQLLHSGIGFRFKGSFRQC